MVKRLDRDFFTRDVLHVAPDLVGKKLVRKSDDESIQGYMITEVEAYRGTEDLACHASKGRTPRTDVMFQHGGLVYVYFIYGMYWMLNVVTGESNNPQAVLIRGLGGCYGPGRITKQLSIDKSFYGEDLTSSNRLWIENSEFSGLVKTAPRIGVNYAGEIWSKMPWRFFTDDEK